jgi:ATP-dependent Clp protease ATP-binding subunit ClpC
MEVLEVLARKGKSSAILVGEAGVGKTKIVEGLALRAAVERDGGLLAGKRVLELNLSSLMAGTQYRGAFEQRVGALIKELENDENVILFIDEIHLIMGAGSTDGGGMDLANLLKPTLSRGRIKCIGATTLQEYRKFIGKDPAIERRFQMVRVEPLTPEATLRVLEKLRPSLEKHHGVKITSESLKTAIDMTVRYLPNRHLPDKAIDALDQACARYRIHRAASTASMRGRERQEVNCHDIRRVVSQLAGVPLEEVTVQERRALIDLDRRLAARIVGQDEAVAKAAAAVKKARAGLADPDRPDASMLFLGPTGVGKTQLAKELARNVLGSRNHLITFDMSEFIEAHSVSRLIGAPPGYVGSEKEGLLTEAVANNPFSIVLFDEIEKAHPQIFDIFLPILDEGRLKDSQGKMVSFRNTMIIFTSNIGANVLSDPTFDHNLETVLDELRKHFRPEFINRIDEVVPFYPLLAEDVRTILRQMIDRLRLRLKDKNIGIRMYQRAYEYLGEKGYDPQYGARELQRAVERHIAGPLSEMLLEGKFAAGDMVDVLVEGDTLLFRKGDPSSKQRAGAE